MKFYVVEYTYFEQSEKDNSPKILYRLFDQENSQNDAEKFCAEVKAGGGAVNLRVRNIDPSLFK